MVRVGSVLWSDPGIDVASDCQEVVRWDIPDSCCEGCVEFLHLLRWSHVGG